MGLKEEFTKLGNEVRKLVALVQNQATVWKDTVDAQVQRLEDWKDNFQAKVLREKNGRMHKKHIKEFL